MYNSGDFGLIEVRAYGHYDFKVTKPDVFLREVIATDGEVTIDELVGKLRSKLASGFADMLNETQVPLAQLMGQFDGSARR